jgi:drug/metabolite transporter (DMT)-like permease
VFPRCSRAGGTAKLDRRVALALLLVTAGGMVLAVDSARRHGPRRRPDGRGAGHAAGGTDNALSRALAERDPGQVVMLKGSLGAAATALIALAVGDSPPAIGAALGLLAVGAMGFGLSLRLYLLAQRAFGAARTGSVFAFAPFVGALVAFALGERPGGAWMLAGAALMLCGVVLHLGERHAHEHQHEALEHEHAHRHDDGHHAHPHEHMPAGPHSHHHVHEPLRHAHPHVPDAHHAHRHVKD